MMKKLISLFVSICLLLSLAACYVKNEHNVEGTTAAEIITEIVTDPAETIATEATTGFVPSPEAPILDFDVTGFDIIEDYEGNPCLIVYFIWTNTTDETTNFWATYNVQAFQDGVSLTPIIFWDDTENGELMNNYGVDIRPNATIELAETFILRSESPIIEIEVAPTFSFSDKPLMLLNVDTSAKG
jgi:hypothetical protein